MLWFEGYYLKIQPFLGATDMLGLRIRIRYLELGHVFESNCFFTHFICLDNHNIKNVSLYQDC